MKETALVHMEVPEEARLIDETSEVLNLTDNGVDMKTSTFLRWLSLNYVGTAVTFATGFAADIMAATIPVDGAENSMLGVTVTVGIITAISSAAHGIGLLMEKDIYRNVRWEVRKQAKQISPEEWRQVLGTEVKQTGYPYRNSNKNGRIRIRNRSVRDATITAFLPTRIFKKKLVSETVWYEPREDNFIRESHYMGFAHYTKVTEKFAGRRKSFQAALDSL